MDDVILRDIKDLARMFGRVLTPDVERKSDDIDSDARAYLHSDKGASNRLARLVWMAVQSRQGVGWTANLRTYEAQQQCLTIETALRNEGLIAGG